jgi:hypothetical protein
MRCLVDSNITTVEAYAVEVPDVLQNYLSDEVHDVDSESINVLKRDTSLVSSEYPPDNVLDEHPKRVSKIDWGVGEYLLTVDGSGSSAVIGSTNARVAEFVVYDSEGGEVHREVVDLGGISTYARFILDSGLALNYAGITYPYQQTTHTITIKLSTGNSDNLYVGLIQAGVMYKTSRDVSIGLNEGQKDYSIEKEMSNGSFYYKMRDIVRVFTGSVLLDREPDFYEFMYSIFKKKGKAPLFWQITNLESERWFVYARAVELPTGSHTDHHRSTVNFQLIEVL